MGALTIQ